MESAQSSPLLNKLLLPLYWYVLILGLLFDPFSIYYKYIPLLTYMQYYVFSGRISTKEDTVMLDMLFSKKKRQQNRH